MEVKQIYDLLNDITGEILGQSDIVKEDLSNVVDVGTAIFDATAIDNYVRSLVDHIGKVIFVNRPYRGSVPSVLMDSWEFGSVVEKIRVDLPEAEENESWELTDGASYDPNIFRKPVVHAKFFNSKVTFEIPVSITEMQVKESFSSANQLNGFISMIYNAVDKSMNIKIDSLVMRTINNFIGETFYDEFPAGSYGTSSNKAINILALYNATLDTPISADEALYNMDFLKFASYYMGMTYRRLSKPSTLFNIGGTDKFTSSDDIRVIMLADFAEAANIYLQSDTFHDEYTKFPKADEVPYWQASGDDYDFDSVSAINITTASGHDVNATGILAVMFDRDALGVTNLSRRVTSNYNAKGEFWNHWYKFDAGYFNDTDENFVVFYIADAS